MEDFSGKTDEELFEQAKMLVGPGDWVSATPVLLEYARRRPVDAKAQFHAAMALHSTGKVLECYPYAVTALKLGFDPDRVDPMIFDVALLHRGHNTHEIGAAILEDVLKHRKDDLDVAIEMAMFYKNLGRVDEAIDILKTFDNPEMYGHATVLTLIFELYHQIGNMDEVEKYQKRVRETYPNCVPAIKDTAFFTMYDHTLTQQEYFEKFQSVGSALALKNVTLPDFKNKNRDPLRPLKVGICSADFRHHVVGLNIIKLIEELDKSKIDLYLYSDTKMEDDMTIMFKSFAKKWKRWRVIHQTQDDVVAKIMREDGIDIVVFLAGSFDGNRSQLAEHRCAPIQVSCHDCATSGLSQMDYYLTDSVIHSPNNTTELFTEELYRLPVFYNYPPPRPRTIFMDPPQTRNGYVTFGHLGKPEKVNDDVLMLWSSVLLSVPNSKLLLKYFNLYNNQHIRSRILNTLSKYGIDESRVNMMCRFDSGEDHSNLYNEIDVALDPFPFSGATGTSDALSSGVPVVILKGNRFVSMMGADIVTHAGHPEWVCYGYDAYVDEAKRLAEDIGLLKKYRSSLAIEFANSPICDAKSYSRSFETAFRDMWHKWLDKSWLSGV